MNTLIHGGVCALAALVVLRFFGRQRRLLATVAATVFAVHPVHVEVVANITGRAETLSAACMLASVLSYCHGRELGVARGWRWLLVALLLVGAGVLFKETSVVTPALFVGYVAVGACMHFCCLQ